MLREMNEPSDLLRNQRKHIVGADPDHDLIGSTSKHIWQSLESVISEVAADSEVAKSEAPVARPSFQLADPIERLSLSRRAAGTETCHDCCTVLDDGSPTEERWWRIRCGHCFAILK